MDKWIALVPLVLGVLMVAPGVFILRLAWLMRGFNRQIAAQGVDVQAEVTAHRSLKAKRGNRTFYITTTYSAPVAGGALQTFTTESMVSQSDYERLNPGDKITVRYLPGAPKEMILAGGVRDQSVQWMLVPGLAVTAAGAVLILIAAAIWLHVPTLR